MTSVLLMVMKMTINTVVTFAYFVFLYCISKETVLSVAVSIAVLINSCGFYSRAASIQGGFCLRKYGDSIL